MLARPPSQPRKLGMMVHTCYLSYVGGINWKIPWGKKMLFPKNNYNKKGWGVWLK
jgi:hypothetical protein